MSKNWGAVEARPKIGSILKNKGLFVRILDALVLAASVMLTACGGGGGGSDAPANCFSGVKLSATPYPQVTMVTTKGTIVVELYPFNAPITVANFLDYVKADFYKLKIFHRVVNNFVIQGGGFDAALVQAPTSPPIKLEVCNGLSNVRGTIAMARTTVAESASSQFFINVVDNISLDTNGGGYAVFGKVVSGMDVVDAIKVVPTQTQSGFTDVPVTPVVITALTKTQ
jgi:cyclophilin family peptidyl-prolyl cis-trans isomerase